MSLSKEQNSQLIPLQNILNASPIIIWAVDKERVFTVSQGKGLEGLGLKPNEMVGKNHHEEFKDSPEVIALMERSFKGEQFTIDVELRGRWYSTTYSPLYDEEGTVCSVSGVSQDITKEKMSYLAAEASQSQLKLITDSLPALISYVDSRYVYQFVNDAYCQWFHRPSQEIIGHTVEELIGQKAFQARKELLDKTLEKGENLNFEDITKHPDLGDRMTQISYIPDIGPQGNIRGAIILAIDQTDKLNALTEARRERERMAITEERLHLALRSGQMGLWHFDLKTHQVTLSPELLQILGLDEVNGSIYEVNTKLIHPDDKDAVNEAWLRAVRERSLYSMEYRIIRPNGEVRWIFSSGKARYDEDGEAQFFSGLTFDVTQRKKTENDLKSALATRDEFLSIASHELKTPLTSLLIQAQLQKRFLENDEESTLSREKALQVLELTERLTLKLNRLVDDMLDISRIRSGKMNIQASAIDLYQLTQEVLARFGASLEGHNIKPTLRGQSVTGNWDPLRIEQVIVNLLTNAIKYGKGRPVEVQVYPQGSKAILCVKDQGMGISKEHQQKIFNRFERAINAYEISGLGLGLYITQQIVEAHGGKIWVESELGQGANFFVELPFRS